jgi:hypothetical protein
MGYLKTIIETGDTPTAKVLDWIIQALIVVSLKKGFYPTYPPKRWLQMEEQLTERPKRNSSHYARSL